MKTIYYHSKVYHMPYPVYSTPTTEGVDELMRVIISYLDSVDVPVFIWCRGSSGLYLASMAKADCENPDVHIKYIRKPNEGSHCEAPHTLRSHLDYDHSSPDVLNIIVDDFISSGRTLMEIFKELVELSIPQIDYIITGTRESDESSLRAAVSDPAFDSVNVLAYSIAKTD